MKPIPLIALFLISSVSAAENPRIRFENPFDFEHIRQPVATRVDLSPDLLPKSVEMTVASLDQYVGIKDTATGELVPVLRELGQCPPSSSALGATPDLDRNIRLNRWQTVDQFTLSGQDRLGRLRFSSAGVPWFHACGQLGPLQRKIRTLNWRIINLVAVVTKGVFAVLYPQKTYRLAAQTCSPKISRG